MSSTSRKKVRYEDVLQAILEDSDVSSSGSESDELSDADSDGEDGSRPSSVTASSVAAAAALAGTSDTVPSTSRAVQDAAADDSSDDDADDGWSCPDFVWHPARYEVPLMHQFTGSQGMNVDATGFSMPDFYKLYLSSDLVNHFVIQTNLCAKQFIETHSNLPPHSRVRRWQDTTADEMCQFIGLVLLMGIIHKPVIEMYWSTDPLYVTPLFSSGMQRNRFSMLLKFFHLNDSTQEPKKEDLNRDRLYKLRPLIDHLFEAFQTVYTPGPSVAVDESLVMWKGRLHFRQYLPLKHARFGIKLFCLAEDSGYLYRFRIYAGKQDPATAMLSVMPSECANFSHTEQVVVYMALPLLDKGYSIFMDNWYSSCRLYDYLHHRQTTACGTMRSNRVPLPVRQSQPAVGQSTAFRCGPLLCLKFKDKKDIYMLTTCHDETMVKPPRSRGRPRTDKETELKPQCIVDYNKNMGSVDRVDAVLHPYSAARKLMK